MTKLMTSKLKQRNLKHQNFKKKLKLESEN